MKQMGRGLSQSRTRAKGLLLLVHSSRTKLASESFLQAVLQRMRKLWRSIADSSQQGEEARRDLARKLFVSSIYAKRMRRKILTGQGPSRGLDTTASSRLRAASLPGPQSLPKEETLGAQLQSRRATGNRRAPEKVNDSKPIKQSAATARTQRLCTSVRQAPQVPDASLRILRLQLSRRGWVPRRINSMKC